MSELFGRWIILTKLSFFFKKELASSVTGLCILVVRQSSRRDVIHSLLTSTQAAPQRGLLGQWDCSVWHDSIGSALYVCKCTERTPRVSPHVNHGLWVIMTCSWRLISSNNCTTLVGDVDHGEAGHMLGRRDWEISVLRTQFCIAPKTALKKQSLLETATKRSSSFFPSQLNSSGPQGRLGSSSPSSSPQNYKKPPKLVYN